MNILEFTIDHEFDLVDHEIKNKLPFMGMSVSSLQSNVIGVYEIALGTHVVNLLWVAGVVAIAVGLVIVYAMLVWATAIVQIALTLKGLP